MAIFRLYETLLFIRTEKVRCKSCSNSLYHGLFFLKKNFDNFVLFVNKNKSSLGPINCEHEVVHHAIVIPFKDYFNDQGKLVFVLCTQTIIMEQHYYSYSCISL